MHQLKKKINNLKAFSDNEIVKILEEYEFFKGYRVETKIEKITGKFGFDDNMLKRKISRLSGGERTKLALCRLLLKKRDLLLLDEPTNHLEISAREALEDALKLFPGAIIFASHDRYLVDKLATQKITLS